MASKSNISMLIRLKWVIKVKIIDKCRKASSIEVCYRISWHVVFRGTKWAMMDTDNSVVGKGTSVILSTVNLKIIINKCYN